jgi:cardiolipin synthase
MSPLISWQIITQQSDLALLTLAIASVTDVLDGYIARRYNMKTKLGSFLDPIADKVLVTTLVGSLWYTSALEPSLGGLILSRDILLVTGVGIYRAKALEFSRDFFNFKIATPQLEEVKPPMISKINTGLQLGLLGLLVGNGVLWEIPIFLLGLKYILFILF